MGKSCAGPAPGIAITDVKVINHNAPAAEDDGEDAAKSVFFMFSWKYICYFLPTWHVAPPAGILPEY